MRHLLHLKNITYLGIVLALFALGVLTPNISSATIYYVATTGKDSNPGTKNSPFRTIKYGIKHLSPGDTLYVKSGNYYESILSWQTPIAAGTSWDNPVTIAAFPGDTVTIKAHPGQGAFWLKDTRIQYLIIDGFIMDGARGALHGVKLEGLKHIRVQNSEIKNSVYSGVLAGGCNGCDPLISYDTYYEFIKLNVHHNGSSVKDHGFYIGSSRNLVEYCDIHHNSTLGGKFFNGNYAPGASASTAVNHNVLRYNTIHHNSQNAVYPNDPTHVVQASGWILASGDGNEAYGNIFYDQPKGLTIGNGATNALAYNNIVYNNSHTGIWSQGSWGGSTNARIFNNTVYNNGQYGILVEANAKDTQIKNNIAFQNGSDTSKNIWLEPNKSPGAVTSHNLLTDPKFLNVSAYDFKLQSGSPAINAGLAIPEVTIDLFGLERNQGSGYDIGAIEQPQEEDHTPPSTPQAVTMQ